MSEDSTNQSIWADDYLQRQDEAIYLSNYLSARYQVKKYEAGFVLAVNGDWGMGKSFMMERWSQDIEAAGHPIVRFNAWENDFTAEPLVAFIAEIDNSLKPFFAKIPAAKRLHKEWFDKAKAVLIPTLKVAGFAALKHGAGITAKQAAEVYNAEYGVDADNEIPADKKSDDDNDEDKFDVKSLQEKLSKVVEEKLKEHNNTRDAITAFKNKFAAIVTQLENEPDIQLPIYVFIDELDRCRPDYAIRLLEGIKHLFGIPGLYFIIATNISELAHSIRAVYGEGFSSERYLKRFFDMEYSLPEPSSNGFSIEIMSPLAQLTSKPFATGFEHMAGLQELPTKGLPYIFHRYAAAFNLTLRDQHQASRILETSLISLKSTTIHIHFLIFLSCLYQKSSTIYRNVVSTLTVAPETQISSVYSTNGKSSFSIKIWDGEKLRPKNVTCLEIAQVYFDFLQSINSSIRNALDEDFPSNLHRRLAVSEAEGKPVKKYIEVVSRAGHFAK